MAERPVSMSDHTAISMPIRNLISIVLAVGIGVWAYFGVIERLNKLESWIIAIVGLTFTTLMTTVVGLLMKIL